MGSVTMQIKNTQRKSEQGNVLFLILIAVALFAALSYAVTQSTRSGGGSADRETSILSSASMTQYPAGLRTSVIRMILGGTAVDAMLFNSPSNISGSETVELFHPSGGGALYQNAANDIMATNTAGTWYINANFFVPEIGLTPGGSVSSDDAADVLAFLPGVSSTVCRRLNEEIGMDLSSPGCTFQISTAPQVTLGTPAKISENISSSGDFASQAAAADELEGDGGSCKVLAGLPAGCFCEPSLGTSGQFVFYSSILER